SRRDVSSRVPARECQAGTARSDVANAVVRPMLTGLRLPLTGLPPQEQPVTENFAAAVKATGCNKLIISGVTNDVCMVFLPTGSLPQRRAGFSRARPRPPVHRRRTRTFPRLGPPGIPIAVASPHTRRGRASVRILVGAPGNLQSLCWPILVGPNR